MTARGSVAPPRKRVRRRKNTPSNPLPDHSYPAEFSLDPLVGERLNHMDSDAVIDLCSPPNSPHVVIDASTDNPSGIASNDDLRKPNDVPQNSNGVVEKIPDRKFPYKVPSRC